MIINSSFFQGDIHLSQVGDNASSSANNNALLQKAILEYEPEILKKGLGRKLYDEFDASLEVNGTLKGTADPKWDRLLNGHTYTNDSIDYYWRGIVEKHGTYQKSLIAYYIYCHYLIDNNTINTVMGTGKGKSKNVRGASPVNKHTKAWRKFYEWYYGKSEGSQGIAYWDRGVYIEDYFQGDDNTKEVSLFQFLTDNKEDYPSWYFTNVENKNSWGL